MKFTLCLSLLFAMVCTCAAEESKAPAEAAAPATAAGDAPSVPPEREAFEQAFDGAMTCSALTAVKAHQATEAKEAEAWRWGYRSFAFGMLAVRFYTDATKQQLTNEDADNMLTEYANSLVSMTPEQREPFEVGCARKYAEIDKLCEINKCPHTPAADAAVTPGAKPELEPEFTPPTAVD